MNARQTLTQINATRYVTTDGHVMQREMGKSPNGNEFDNRWVLRDPQGCYLDHDRYSNDLAERHNLFFGREIA